MSQTEIVLVVGLLILAIPLVALARRAGISYPIVLVVGGLLLGFVPGLPHVEFDPNVVLLIFLPPLLYWEAITAPTDIMLANTTQIAMLAVGLVAFTTVIVTFAVHAIVPNLPWAVAAVLGAIVAPTDELTAAPVLERFRMPRHVTAIVEGESLVNDAAALVLYAAAVTAAVDGSFDLPHTLLSFVVAPIGALIVGWLVARAGVEGWRRISDGELQGVISLVLPFVAYVPAQRLGLSGVLAVVTTGVYANRFTPTVVTPAARLSVIGFWDTFVFVANILLFLLVGLQLHTIATSVFAHYPWQTILWSTLAVNLAVVLVRFAWVMGTEYVPLVGGSSEHPEGDWKHALVVSWSGMRGAVSLAAALAIPATVTGGAPFPGRDLLIFITFTVILVTLVAGGLSLPWLIERLGTSDDGQEEGRELVLALAGITRAALARIDELESEGRLASSHALMLRKRYEHKRALAAGSPDDQRHADEDARTAELSVLESERQELVAMRERGEIDNAVLRRVMRSLDLEESRLLH